MSLIARLQDAQSILWLSIHTVAPLYIVFLKLPFVCGLICNGCMATKQQFTNNSMVLKKYCCFVQLQLGCHTTIHFVMSDKMPCTSTCIHTHTLRHTCTCTHKRTHTHAHVHMHLHIQKLPILKKPGRWPFKNDSLIWWSDASHVKLFWPKT